MADLANGVLDFDAHTWPQARCVATATAGPAAALSVVGRLSRAKAAWRVFKEAAGLAVDFPDVRRNEHQQHQHRSDADRPQHTHAAAHDAASRGGLVHLFDDRAWDVFCSQYRRDYACLGFAAPPPCAARWKAAPPKEGLPSWPSPRRRRR